MTSRGKTFWNVPSLLALVMGIALSMNCHAAQEPSVQPSVQPALQPAVQPAGEPELPVSELIESELPVSETLVEEHAESVQPEASHTSDQEFKETAISKPAGEMLIVIGSTGTPEYRAMFLDWAEKWEQAAAVANFKFTKLGGDDVSGNIQEIEEAIQALQTVGQALNSTDENLTDDATTANDAAKNETPLWVIFIGHGTFDGQNTLFNIPGDDLSPSSLGRMFSQLNRKTALILCFSSSGSFLQSLSGPDRVVITATRHGNEFNFARFGGYLADSLNASEADIDHDLQISLLEMFLFASRKATEYYELQDRIVTEHALLDDNGDGQPVTADGFRLLEPINRKPVNGRELDGVFAHQWQVITAVGEKILTAEEIAERNRLELEIQQLKSLKSQLEPDDYYQRLEVLLLEIAEVVLPARPKIFDDEPGLNATEHDSTDQYSNEHKSIDVEPIVPQLSPEASDEEDQLSASPTESGGQN